MSGSCSEKKLPLLRYSMRRINVGRSFFYQILFLLYPCSLGCRRSCPTSQSFTFYRPQQPRHFFSFLLVYLCMFSSIFLSFSSVVERILRNDNSVKKEREKRKKQPLRQIYCVVKQY